MSGTFLESQDSTDIMFQSIFPLAAASSSNYTVSEGIKVKGLHRDLTLALVDHLWENMVPNKNMRSISVYLEGWSGCVPGYGLLLRGTVHGSQDLGFIENCLGQALVRLPKK